MSLSPGQLLRGLAVVVFLAVWAFLAHTGSAGEGSGDLSVLLGISPIVAALGLLLWRSSHPALTGTGILAMLGALAWYWPTLRENIALLFFIQHLGTNLALGTLFGRSLLGGGEALITQLARAVHEANLSELKRRYTRQATLAWTLFFLGNALISAVLWLLAPHTIWSIYANLLSAPLLGAMFIGEHIWRLKALPPDERPSITQVVSAYRMRSQQKASAADLETPQPPANPS
ncbi:MAG: transmembrane protein [Rhodocyclaceae bacterium]|nr:MAG: transmembrane protein [Rhodocyclaceae bacterium]